MLTGRSMGTLVAFETLVLNTDLNVDTPITLGSPLGMRTIANRLRGRPSSGGLPTPAVRRWVNIFDPRDPVAGAGRLDWLWPMVEDYGVHNGDLPHAIGRYLSKKITGKVVADAAAATSK